MSLSDIIFVRHGKPDCPTPPRLSQREVAAWLREYGRSGIAAEPPSSDACRAAVQSARVVLSSTLRRSSESAAVLAGDRVTAHALFTEASLAIPTVGLALSPSLWTVIGRLTWLMGAASAENLSATRQRAEQAAAFLLAEAENGPVAVIAHGWINRMIAQALCKRGMRVVEKTGSRYWSYTRLQAIPR